MKLNKKIYIIILNYNTWKDTIEAILSIINNDYKNFQIILIDNCSPNESEKKLRDWLSGDLDFKIENNFFDKKLNVAFKQILPFVYYTEEHKLQRDIVYENKVYNDFLATHSNCNIEYPILFVQTGKNLGFAGGNNIALRALIDSTEDAYVFLLNPDTFLEKNALGILIQKSSISEKFLEGLKILEYKNPDLLTTIGGYKLNKFTALPKNIKEIADIHSLDYIYGGALFTNIVTLKFIGAMPEDYFLYWEETDWCYGAKKQGVQLKAIDSAICYDKVGTSTGRGFLSEYYFTYNSMLFYKKYLNQYIYTLFLFHLLRLSVKIIKNKREQAKALFKALTDYVKGTRSEIK